MQQQKLNLLRNMLTVFVVLILLNMGITKHSGIFGYNEDKDVYTQRQNSDLNTVINDDKLKLVHHHIKGRSVSKSIGNLQIRRNGSSPITVTHNGRTLHYKGRGIVDGMLQEFFGIQPEVSAEKDSNGLLSSTSISHGSSQTSSSYTSIRESDNPGNKQAENVILTDSSITDSSHHDVPDAIQTTSERPQLLISTTDVPPADPHLTHLNTNHNSAAASRQGTANEGVVHEPNYWSDVGHTVAPPPVLPRKPSYVEYFTMMTIPGISSKNPGQRFSGYAYRIKNEDRLLFPRFGQQHLRAVMGMPKFPLFLSGHHGPNKTLDFISQAVISGMHAQFFGVKKSAQ